MPRLPKYVHGFVDRHGKPRFYLRRKGNQKVPLPGLPYSTAFMDAYAEAMAAQTPIQPGRGKIKPGSMKALALSYFASPAFLIELKPSSQRAYRGAIERFCNRRDANGVPYGDKLAVDMQRIAVVKLVGARSQQTRSANFLLNMLRILMAYAIELGWRTDNPARDVKPFRIRSDGFHSWSEQEISRFEAYWPAGSRERLATYLLLFTGQRGRSDVIRMGRQHVQDGMLRIRQQKTGAELIIPVAAPLAEAIATLPAGQMTFLTNQYGRPYTPAGFGNWFREACRSAGLPHCSAHGLRKAAARRLAEAGCTEHEISSITGHASLKEVQRYTKSADQKRLAIAAMAKVKTST